MPWDGESDQRRIQKTAMIGRQKDRTRWGNMFKTLSRQPKVTPYERLQEIPLNAIVALHSGSMIHWHNDIIRNFF